MSDVRTLLKKRPLLFDGGMGTYYKGAPGRECEQANRLDPEGIRAVHRAYLAAGADAIKTNTFGLPRMAAAQDPEWECQKNVCWAIWQVSKSCFSVWNLPMVRQRPILLWR